MINYAGSIFNSFVMGFLVGDEIIRKVVEATHSKPLYPELPSQLSTCEKIVVVVGSIFSALVAAILNIICVDGDRFLPVRLSFMRPLSALASVGIMGLFFPIFIKQTSGEILSPPEASVSRMNCFIQMYRKEYREIMNTCPSWDVAQRNTIHPLYYHNRIFSKYICPMTGVAIRNPVVDPISNVLYERCALERWIDLHQISPATNAPLKKEDLIVPLPIKKAIDDELQKIQDQLNIIDIELAEEEAREQMENKVPL